MNAFKSTIGWARAHALWLALAALPLILAACHNGNSRAVGVPVALNPTITGCNRLIWPCAYSSAVPR